MSRLKSNSLNEVIQVLDPGDVASNRISIRWNSDEAQMAIKGFRNHGKNFQAIAEIIGTKTEQYVRQFYNNYRKRYNLDTIVKEFEEKQQQDQKNHINDTQSTYSTVPDTSKSINSTSYIKNELNKSKAENIEVMEVSLKDLDI